MAPLGLAALAGLCEGGYLGALLGPPPYLVSLRANSLAQPEGTECLSPSPAFGRVLSMNRTPGEQWLLEQADRFNDGPPTASLDTVWLPDPRLLPRAVTNPIIRPLGARFPEWFDVRRTSEGAQLAQELGVNSGYFQEYQNWAPFVA